ncbi:MAG: ribbon-helix-helix protein, CopG family [Desulfatiglans sp.]|jgi:metal-responsive CopG/Arc/MetJ family transcriptional regulator|nr:ribbon-helix-helix protein, CopG family [Desulfatiglans sp.]
MKTLSVKLPENLLERLDSTAAQKGESRSALLREAIETIVNGEGGSLKGSCMELAKDLAGSVNGPVDLSYNKTRMAEYGK